MLLALTATVSACSSTPSVEIRTPAQEAGDLPADTQAQLDAAVAEAMAATGASGAIVGVWVPWSGQWVAGLGTQTPGSDDVVDADMVFRAGPVTRAMTCDVLFALDERGILSVDDPVSAWVSGAAGLHQATLGQLCDSTSGVGSYRPLVWDKFIQTPRRVWSPLELAAYGMGQESSVPPGRVVTDSDAGYLLLGQALEAASGESLADLIAEYVTEPLGLDATVLPDSAPTTPAGNGRATSLRGTHALPGDDGVLQCAEPRDITVLSASAGGADAGIVSSISDLGRYAQAVATGALGGKGATRLDGALPAFPDAPGWFTYGGGVYQVGSLVGQHGSMPGYTTAAYADPQTGLTVAVVLNSSTAASDTAGVLAWELASIASKAPAAAGREAPAAGLPWTAQQQHEAVLARAVCPVPAS